MVPETHRTPYVRLRVSLVAPRDPLGRAHSLWLGGDHLLWVRTGYFNQTVSRIDFRDIEAITVRPTALYAWTNALAAVPCLLGIGLMAAAPDAWAVLGAVLLVPCLAILLANLLLDRTCECHLQTRAGTRTLYALGRYPHVRRALPLLLPRIEAAQAGLPPVREVLAAIPTVAGSPAPDGARRPQARHFLHAVCFGMLAVQASLCLLTVRFTSLALVLSCLLWAALLAAVCLVTAGLQHRRAVATRLRIVTWAITAGTLLGWGVWYACFWFAVVRRELVTDGFSMENQLDRLVLRYARELVREGLPDVMSAALLGLAVLAALMALIGFAIFLTVPPVTAMPPGAPVRSAPRPPEGP